MFRARDIVMVIVAYATLGCGILRPGWGVVFQPHLTAFIMLLLFLSFLPIRAGAVWGTVRESPRLVAGLTALKLLAVPLVFFGVFRLFWPAYALSALLLSGVSTGVVAPFIAGIVGANGALVLVLVVTTSVLVPVTLPALVGFLGGRYIEIPASAMIRMLALVVLVPLVAAEGVKRFFPRWAAAVNRVRFSLSLVLLGMVNLAVFSRYAPFFRQSPATLVEAALAAFLLSGMYLGVGIVLFRRASLEDQLAGTVAMANMNNVLVVVFASRFFGPLESTVAAMYLLPFYGVIVPLRMVACAREGVS